MEIQMLSDVKNVHLKPGQWSQLVLFKHKELQKMSDRQWFSCHSLFKETADRYVIHVILAWNQLPSG